MRSLTDHIATTQRTQIRELSLIDFIESPEGFNSTLFPAQRFMLKLLEQEELDDSAPDIVVRDRFNEHPIADPFTEREFYEFLYEHSQISMTYDDYLAHDIIQVLLAIGRRGGKTSTIAFWIGAKLYQILQQPHPQRYFGILPRDPINIVITALGEDNATKIFSRISKLVGGSEFFAKHSLKESNVQSLKLWSDHDIEQIPETRRGSPPEHSNSITVEARANSPGVRGDNNIVCVMEEVAHFNDGYKSTKTKPLDKIIYEALTPSVSNFKYPDGSPFGRIFLISSPAGRSGKFYEEYQNAFDLGPDSACLAVQGPSRFFNPEISPVYLRTEFRKSPLAFEREFEAKFTEGSRSIANTAKVERIWDPSREIRPEEAVRKRRTRYFAGLDFGLSDDGCAVAICHHDPEFVETESHLSPTALRALTPGEEEFLDEIYPDLGVPRSMYVVDYVESWYPGVEPFANSEVLDLEEIVDLVAAIFGRWNPAMGMGDQWSRDVVAPILRKAGLTNVVLPQFTVANLNTVATTMTQIIESCRIKVPSDPDLRQEFDGLRTHISNKRSEIKHEAIRGGHDDSYDAIARAVFCCYAHLNGVKEFGGVDLRSAMGARNHVSVRVRGREARGLRVPGFASNRHRARPAMSREERLYRRHMYQRRHERIYG